MTQKLMEIILSKLDAADIILLATLYVLHSTLTGIKEPLININHELGEIMQLLKTALQKKETTNGPQNMLDP